MNPRGTNQPNLDPRLHPVTAPEQTLVESLGSIVDEANQIAVDLGDRPYRVFAVTYRWTGGAVGRGTAEVFSVVEFLPTPVISSMTAVAERHLSAGVVERGGLSISQISPRYTEDQIETLCRGERDCRGPAFETFIEIAMDRRDGTDVPRRRFTLEGPPFRDTRALGWTVRVARQDQDRERDGSVPAVGMHDPYVRRRG